MKREELKALIQQEIAKLTQEDFIIPPEEAGAMFRARAPEPDDHERPSGCGSSDQDSYSYDSQDLPSDGMKLKCSMCGGLLVMEGDCGCGTSLPMTYPVPQVMVDDPHEHKKKGAYMAKAQLHKLKEYSEKLQHMIPENYDLEDWMRSHISQAADDIAEVFHKLEYSQSKE